MLGTPYWKYPLQTNTFVTGDSKESTTWVLFLSRQVEWMIRVEQCGPFRIPCKTSVSMQGVLSVLWMNRVWAIYSFAVRVFIHSSHLYIYLKVLKSSIFSLLGHIGNLILDVCPFVIFIELFLKCGNWGSFQLNLASRVP